MKRPLRPDELHLWSTVAATVHPFPGRSAPKPPPVEPATPASPPRHVAPSPLVRQSAPHQRVGLTQAEPRPIEPGRRRRLTRGRDPVGARIDLHGLDQDRARAALEAFLRCAWDEGWRAVLVITGKGTLGAGVLRRRTPEWLASPSLAAIVAGVSEAHRRHGGEGALYVALKRKPRG